MVGGCHCDADQPKAFHILSSSTLHSVLFGRGRVSSQKRYLKTSLPLGRVDWGVLWRMRATCIQMFHDPFLPRSYDRTKRPVTRKCACPAACASTCVHVFTMYRSIITRMYALAYARVIARVVVLVRVYRVRIRACMRRRTSQILRRKVAWRRVPATPSTVEQPNFTIMFHIYIYIYTHPRCIYSGM